MARLPVEVHPDALAEAQAAYRWYSERSETAAKFFLAELENAVEFISADPARYPVYLDRARRFLLKRFPFGIIYRRSDETVQILAVAHARRKPGYWKRR